MDPCVSVSIGFECSHDPDPLNQVVYDFIPFTQDVSLAGSEWNRGLASTLNLQQSDYFVESLASVLALVDIANGGVDRIRAVSDTISFLSSTTVSGGRVPGGGGLELEEAIFDSNTSAGMVVYVTGNGTVDLALADDIMTAEGIALAVNDVIATNTDDYRNFGRLTVADWTPVIGTQFLTPGAVYFLSASVSGGLTTTPPSNAGEVILRVGTAATTTGLEVEIAQPLQL